MKWTNTKFKPTEDRKERLEGLWAMGFRPVHAERTRRSPLCVGGVTFQSSPARPGALLPPHPPGTPSRSPCAHRQAGAGRCHWFPFAYFLVPTTTHQKVHQYLYHQTSQTWWQEVCVTRAFCWAWRVAMLPRSWHGQAKTHMQVSLRKATACQHTAGEISGSLHSKLLTLKCLHEVLLSTPPIQTWDGVYVKWVIISFNSLLLHWANILSSSALLSVSFLFFKTYMAFNYFFKLLPSFCLNEASLLDIAFAALFAWLCLGSESRAYLCFTV